MMTSHTETDAVSSLDPRPVWEIFAGIAAVPRPSKHEERIRRHVRGFAEQQGLSVREDATGNLVIEVPASKGLDNAPGTVLQAHLDMVCEKNASTDHDFDKEGIRLILTKDAETGEQIVRGDGTTLGADNGIGVALALAVATQPDVEHGPLELLLTIDEEDGMTGAKGLAKNAFRARRMLNLDSEEDDALYIGCAGGCDTNLTWDFESTPLPSSSQAFRISVSGLRGGHSGGDIHEGRANAIKVLTRTLLRAPEDSIRLVDITGGSKRNAIPREAAAILTGDAACLEAVRAAAVVVALEAKEESFEPQVSITVEPVSKIPSGGGLSAGDTARLLAALAALPSGVLGMHPKVDGLVETSNNVSTISTAREGDGIRVEVGTLSRSSSASRIRETLEVIASVGTLAGAEVARANEYPGWSPNADSPTLAVCRRVYKDQFGREPKVAAIHAGLECGIIGERVGGVDMVSLGPTIRGAHSPDERVFVESVRRTWTYLTALLKALAQS